MHSGTSEQHKELRPSSEVRDNADLKQFVQWLEAHPPFTEWQPNMFVSLAIGIVTDGSVNCDNAIEIGDSALKKMTGKTFSELKLHRKDKVK